MTRKKSTNGSTKEKITISIDNIVLDNIDKEIKVHKTYPNRSVAIESLVRSALPRMEKAVLLLTGHDLLFKDEQLDLCVVEVENLVRGGVHEVDIFFNSHSAEFVWTQLAPKLQQLQERVGRRALSFELVPDESTRGDAAVLVGEHRDTPLCLVHGTMIRGKSLEEKLDVDKVFQFHRANKCGLTLVLGDVRQRDPSVVGIARTEEEEQPSFGTVRMEGSAVVEIIPPNDPRPSTSFADLGFYIIEPTILEYIHDYSQKYNSDESIISFTHPRAEGEKSIIGRLLAEGHRVSGYVYAGKWYHLRRFATGADKKS